MRHYIGIDFHTQHSSVAVMNNKGDIIDERRLYHNDPKFFEYFSSFEKGTHVAIEATRNWYWLVDYLQGLDLDVKLVHAKKARVIAESTIKTDKIDARILAHLDRCSFLPQAYITDKKSRSQRELLRYYMGLVSIRTGVKNRVHTILAKNNIQHDFSDLFGKSGTVFLKELQLPPIFSMELQGYLQLLEELKCLIDNAQKEIKSVCKESRYTEHLMTIPGISYFSALLLEAEIADINRFKTFKKLCSYAGLVSTTHQSAEVQYHGHIVKDSNKYIRTVLIEAIPITVKRDQKLWAFYTKIQRKKGKNKAKIATARKLLIAIYFMLKKSTDYHRSKNNYRFQVNPSLTLGASAAPIG